VGQCAAHAAAVQGRFGDREGASGGSKALDGVGAWGRTAGRGFAGVWSAGSVPDQGAEHAAVSERAAVCNAEPAGAERAVSDADADAESQRASAVWRDAVPNAGAIPDAAALWRDALSDAGAAPDALSDAVRCGADA